MDPSDTALARLHGRPYRDSPETSLELMLRSGALAPVRRPGLRERLGLGAAVLVVSFAVFGLDAAQQILGGFALVAFLVVCARSGGAFSPKSGSLTDLRARIEAYPIPVTGDVARWVDAGELWLGSFDLVLHERHPQLEATVRLAEPEARLEWRGPATLRVEPLWDRDGRDFPRLDRLVALLNIYRDELGLERIELGSTYRLAEPNLDG